MCLYKPFFWLTQKLNLLLMIMLIVSCHEQKNSTETSSTMVDSRSHLNSFNTLNLTHSLPTETSVNNSLLQFLNHGEKENLENLPQNKTVKVTSGIPNNKEIDLHVSIDQISGCVLKYDEAWKDLPGQTRSIFTQLSEKRNASCWSKEMNDEIKGLIQQISKELNQIKTDLLVLNENSPKLSRQELENEKNQKAELLNQLGGHYQELQEYLSFCRLRDITQNAPKIKPIPEMLSNDDEADSYDRALLHIFGDPFGLKPIVEKQNRSEAIWLLEQQRAIIQFMYHHLHTQGYILTQFQSEPCVGMQGGYHPEMNGHALVEFDFPETLLFSLLSHMDTALVLMRSFNQSFEEFIQTYNNHLNQLKEEGQWFYFQGGTLENPIIYTISKEQNDEFAFRIYDSGDGLSIFNGSRKQAYPFLERRGISKQKLLQLSFLRAVYDLDHRNETYSPKMAVLYDSIFQDLGGKLTTQQVNFENLLDPRIQRNDNYYVLPYTDLFTLSESHDFTSSSSLEFIVHSKLLEIYFTLNQNRMNEVNSVRRIAHQLLNDYSEELEKNIYSSSQKRAWYFDGGMARESRERINHYQKVFNDSNRTNDHLDKKELNTEKTDISHSNDQQISSIERCQISLQKNVCLKVQDWNPEPDTVVSDLEKFLVQLQPQRDFDSGHVQQEIQKILDSVPEIVKQIPLEESWLRNLSDVDLRAFIGRLNDLSQFQFWALIGSKFSATRGEQSLSPIAILAQIRMLTLADLAIRIYRARDAGCDFISFPSLYSSQIKTLLADDQTQKWTSVLLISDRYWIDLFKELKKYWENQRISNDEFAFQWDRYPLYSAYVEGRRIYKSDLDMRSDHEAHWSKAYGDPSLKDWKDLLWASSLLPGSHKSLKEIIQSLDYRNKKLPKEFFEIRDISFLTHYVLVGSFAAEVLYNSGLNENLFGKQSYIYRNHEQRISFPVSFYYVNEQEKSVDQKRYHENNYEIFGKSLVLPVRFFDNPATHHLIPLYSQYTLISDPNYALERGTDQSMLSFWNEIIQARKLYLSLERLKDNSPFSLENHSNFPFVSTLSHLPHHVPFLAEPSYNRKIPITYLELQRQLLDLDSPAMTLAYFREHPEYLREKRWQALFKSIIFQPLPLIEEFRKDQTFPDLLSDFLWSNSEFQIQLQDYQTASFFLRMHHLLEEFTEKADWKREKTSMRCARESLKKIVSQLSGISNLKFELSRDVIRTFKYVDLRREPWEDLAFFIEAVIYRGRNLPQEYEVNFDAEEENAIYGVYQHKRNNLDSAIFALSQEQRNALFNHVIHAFRSLDLSAFTWNRVLPVETNSNLKIEIWTGIPSSGFHTLAIDLSIPLILSDEQQEMVLPTKILELPLFKKMVHWNASEPYVKWLGGEKYELVDTDGYQIRVDATPSSNHPTDTLLKIQKRWACRWYQLLSDSYVNQSAMDWNNEENWSDHRENWMVVPGYTNWQFVLEDDACLSSSTDELYSREGGSTSWVQWDNIDFKKAGASEVLAFDKDNEKLFAVIRRRSDADVPMIQKVKYINGQAFIYGTQLSQMKTEDDSQSPQIPMDDSVPFADLSRIEHPRLIWVWKDDHHQVEQIQLPRFGIQFIPIQNRLVSPEMEFFALSKQQKISKESENWGDYSHYIILEKEGNLRVVVPRIKTRESKKDLALIDGFNWVSRSYVETKTKAEESESHRKNSQRFLSWSIDPLDHQLKLPTVEDQFFLAFIHLLGNSSEYHSYERVRELLYGRHSQMGAFKANSPEHLTRGAKEILDWIFSIENHDYNSRAIALRLGAATMVIENDLAEHQMVNWIVDDVNSDQISVSKRSLLPEYCSIRCDDIADLYLKYLNVKDKILGRWFPEELERILLESLMVKKPHDKRFQARFLELNARKEMPKSK